MSCDLIEIKGDKDVIERYVLSCICAYCKACELVPIPYKSAATVTKAFKENIVLRYGPPLCVRTDNGGEFKADFNTLMQNSNTLHITTSPYFA